MTNMFFKMTRNAINPVLQGGCHIARIKRAQFDETSGESKLHFGSWR